MSTKKTSETKLVPTLQLIHQPLKEHLTGTARCRVTYFATSEDSERQDISDGRYKGSFSRYKKYRHFVHCHAASKIERGGRSLSYSVDVYVIDQVQRRQGKLTLPLGWTWMRDENGLSVVNRTSGADYHPGKCELMNTILSPLSFPLSRWTEWATNNLAQRQAAKKLAELDQEDNRQLVNLCERGLVKVTLRDSEACGNCRHGSAEFAKRELSVDVDSDNIYMGINAKRVITLEPRAQAAAIYAARRQSEVCI